MSSFLFTITILLIFISLAKTASLDGTCQSEPDCIGNSLICRNDICQCDAPWYKPCIGSCVIQERFVYEGEECRLDINCLDNARCDNATRRCVCKESYSAFNGLCLKRNNESCSVSNECWSGYCDSALRRCACRMGFESMPDGRCTRKLVRLYANWEQANSSNQDFCYDDYSCLALSAQCRGDATHFERFCQCPTIGYMTDLANQRCDATDIDRLSPMNEPTTDDNTTCIFCKDNNAVCANVGTKATCWCRAGYDKIGDECQNIRNKFLFPSAWDSSEHLYNNNCTYSNSTTSSYDNLCTCAPYQEYDYGARRCKTIERTWISEYFEYGICTRINSDDLAQSPNNALCPPPLQCLANGDKYVCSCGLNRFLEKYSDVQRCVYRLGKPTEGSNQLCPVNAEIYNGTCRCLPGYQQVDDDRRCELMLLTQGSSDGCGSNTSSPAENSCKQLFGGAARYCRPGICRCDPAISYPHPLGILCYGLLDVAQDSTYCPPYTESFQAGTCRCRAEYQKSSDSRVCVPKSLLYEWNEAAINRPDLQASDCRIYKGWVASFDNSAAVKACRCEQVAFRNPTGIECWPRVYTNLSRDVSECNVFNSIFDQGNRRRCICNFGYRPTTPDKKDCGRISARLEEQINMAIPEVDRISNGDCRALFGQLSVENSSRCICPENISFSNNERTRCLAYIDIPTGLSTLGDSSCPENSLINLNDLGKCQCRTGFIPSLGNRVCATADVRLVGTKIRLTSTSCSNFTNENCMVKYGREAFCDNNECWCNRQTSFKIGDSQCESFSHYIFPGLHERNNVSCDVDQDCVRDNIDINTVECIKRTGPSDEYKVCVCKRGWFLNPLTQTCESRCPTDCNERPNSECNGYECACKPGFIESNNNSTCIPNPNRLELYRPCNSSFVGSENDPLQCSVCNRAECDNHHKDTSFQCVRYNFDTDRCVGRLPQFCSNLIRFSECFADNNKCECSSGFYRDGDKCAIPVNLRCTTDDQCGSLALCSGQRCRCLDGRRTQTITDAFGRSIERCVNGVDRLQFSLISLLFLIFVRLFFI